MTESDIEAPFPPGSRIILHGLEGGKEFNDRIGIVQTKPDAENGRYQVVLLPTPEERTQMQPPKMMAIQGKNMKWQPRPLSSLNKVEMQRMLLFKKFNNKVDEAIELKDMSDEGLKEMMKSVIDSEEDIPLLLANTIASQSDMNRGARMKQQVQRMNPDQLRQQAQMMKSMDPKALRERVPQFRSLTDDQIKQAVAQMEAMANDPKQFEGMKSQFSKMSPKEMTMDYGPSASATQTRPALSSLSQMSPAQLLSQAQRLKKMDVSVLRQMNPAWARMTDEQIKLSIEQMEQMANQPAMMEQMKQQVKKMNPNDLEKIRNMARNGQMPSMPPGMPPGMSMGAPPTIAKDAENDNDEGETLTDEQIQQSMDMFDKMEEKQSGKGVGFFLVLILIIGLLGGGGWFYFVKKPQTSMSDEL